MNRSCVRCGILTNLTIDGISTCDECLPEVELAIESDNFPKDWEVKKGKISVEMLSKTEARLIINAVIKGIDNEFMENDAKTARNKLRYSFFKKLTELG